MDQSTDLLPSEVEDMLRLAREEKLAKLAAFGATLASKRDDAVEGRQACGIEQEWIESEDQYQGVDDANRDEGRGYLKPSTSGGSFVGRATSGDTRSTVYLNITRPYVDAAAAKVADMLLPTDDRNWGIKPTPIPALSAALKSDAMMPGAPGQPPVPIRDVASSEMAQAKEQAKAAEKRIEDWLVECQYHAEVRKVIEDCARLGTGILKGPFPQKSRFAAAATFNPASKRIDPWNLYPDPACGESLHNGQYIWEKDEITVRQVKDLIGVPGYLEDQIAKVIEEGPGKKHENSNRGNLRTSVSDKEKFEIWFFHGMVEPEDLEVAGVAVGSSQCGAHAIITMINETVIKAALQPLDNGEFPYDLMPWQRKTNMPWGSGVAKHIRTPQRIVVAGARNLMDNAGVSAGGQFVMRRGAVEPADGKWGITPRKLWFVKEEADLRSVNDAFAMINLPSMQNELMNIIQFAMKMAEDVTGLPQLLQGMQGKAPETVGGMQMLQNNASSVLRRIARTFDDCITEPHIRRYYQWLLEYGEDENEKGDFTIDARGSTALVERDIAQQAILQMGQMVMNPAFGMSPEKWIKEAMKAQKIDPKRFELDDEEKQKMAQQPPPVAPQIEVAKIRAQADAQKAQFMAQQDAQKTQAELAMEREIAQLEHQTMQTRIQVDTDRDVALVNAQHEKNMNDAQLRMQELQVKREIEILRYSTQQKISLDDAKVQLARDSMKLNVQRELAAASGAMDSPQVAAPAFEPAGRAPDGQAFQR